MLTVIIFSVLGILLGGIIALGAEFSLKDGVFVFIIVWLGISLIGCGVACLIGGTEYRKAYNKNEFEIINSEYVILNKNNSIIEVNKIKIGTPKLVIKTSKHAPFGLGKWKNCTLYIKNSK